MQIVKWHGEIGDLRGLFGVMGQPQESIRAEVRSLIRRSPARAENRHSKRVEVVIIWSPEGGLHEGSSVIYL
jgi:hypothetical protein